MRHTDLTGTIDRHVAILNAVANRRAEDAVKASDELMSFMDSMFVEMEAGLDPSLLDCNIDALPGT